jgi:hypothetical protein
VTTQFGAVVHESRLLMFTGIRTGRMTRTGQRPGFGDSIPTRIKAALRGYGLGWQSAETLLADFAQAVWKIHNLAELVAQDRSGEVRERMKLAEESRSVVRAVWIDGEDEFERKQTPLSGLPEILQLEAQKLAAAADTPATVMFGETPQGLNATGKGEDEVWKDKIDQERRKKLTPIIEKLIRVIFAVLKVPEPDEWCVEFGDLTREQPKAKAERKKLEAETDTINIDAGLLHADEAARARARGMDPLESIDFDDRPDPDEGEMKGEPVVPVPGAVPPIGRPLPAAVPNGGRPAAQ